MKHDVADSHSSPSPSAPASRAARSPRNSSVEVLRLVAILGIAIFHTFLPFFNALAYGTTTGVVSQDALSPLTQSGGALFGLGFFSLLGSMGNNIFFMISGFYLMPSLQRDSSASGFWTRQLRKSLRRVVVILAVVAFYAVVAVCVDRWIVDIPGVSLHSANWLVGGLEFVWVYLVVVVVAPIFAWLQRRFTAGWSIAVVVAFFVVTALNCYIAFFSQGGVTRGLTDWRKLMSAATYLVAFLLAGFIGSRWEGFRQLGSSLLWGSLGLSVVVVAGSAMLHDADLLGALSFKSTSLMAFLMALGALLAAVSSGERRLARRQSDGVREENYESRGARCVRFFAGGILGFYVANSVLGAVVSVPVTEAMMRILNLNSVAEGASAGGFSAAIPVGALWGFFGIGIAVSVAYVVVVLCIDRFVAHPVLSLLHLAK